jgi:hypothetical protein
MSSDPNGQDKIDKEMVAYIMRLVEKGKQIEREEKALAKGITISEVIDEEIEILRIDLRGKI